MTDSIATIREYQNSGKKKNFEKIISNLKLISKIQENKKINVTTNEIVGVSYYDRLYRTSLRIEGRKKTLDHVRHVTDEAVNLLYYFRSLKEPFYIRLADIIQEELLKAIQGIKNIAKTYSKSDALASDFEAVITSIRVELDQTTDS